MKTHTKWLALFIVLLMLVPLFCACNQSKETTSTSAPQAPSKSEANCTFYYTPTDNGTVSITGVTFAPHILESNDTFELRFPEKDPNGNAVTGIHINLESGLAESHFIRGDDFENQIQKPLQELVEQGKMTESQYERFLVRFKFFDIPNMSPYLQYEYFGRYPFMEEFKTEAWYTLRDNIPQEDINETIEILHKIDYNPIRIYSNSTESEGYELFFQCFPENKKLSVQIPNTVTSVSFNDTFVNAAAEWENGIAYIEGWAVAYNSNANFDDLQFRNDTIGLGLRFFNCVNLVKITIPDSVKAIPHYAFYCCKNLTNITIGNGVINIGASAFEGCDSLTSVRIADLAAWCNINFQPTTFYPDNVSGSISFPYSNPLFYAGNLYINDTLATNISIPENVTNIADYAFCGCNNLTSISIPSSVTSIGNSAFKYCNSLTSIVIPNSVTSIGLSACANCSNLAYVYYGGTEAEWSQLGLSDYDILYYYSETAPAESGNYWHYVDGVPTPW